MCLVHLKAQNVSMKRLSLILGFTICKLKRGDYLIIGKTYVDGWWGILLILLFGNHRLLRQAYNFLQVEIYFWLIPMFIFTWFSTSNKWRPHHDSLLIQTMLRTNSLIKWFYTYSCFFYNYTKSMKAITLQRWPLMLVHWGVLGYHW